MASPGTCPPLAGRHILLGITGSIAAYKAAVLCRLLKTAGADVRVVMTPLAKQFITPLTMATLSKNPILVEFFDPENGAWNSHVSLGEWADCYLIAPATANTLAKMASGIADNLLLTTYLNKVDGYNGEQVAYTGEIANAAKTRVEVRTEITMKDGTRVPVAYRMMAKDNSWRVYDIIVENLSLVKNYRTQFQDILTSGTPDELIARVKAKAEEVRKQPVGK